MIEESIKVDYELKEFLVTGFRVDNENNEKIISLIYICNPVVALS